MYENLVERLRADADYMDNNGIMLYAAAPFYRECADAIEELSLVAESNERSAARWAETAGKAVEQIPRWIPVTEALPEEFVVVLCYCSRNDQYGCGKWVKEDNGTIYWSGLNGMIPTHWMPLPEPQKEEA